MRMIAALAFAVCAIMAPAAMATSPPSHAIAPSDMTPHERLDVILIQNDTAIVRADLASAPRAGRAAPPGRAYYGDLMTMNARTARPLGGYRLHEDPGRPA